MTHHQRTKGHIMQTFIVFGKLGQYITTADSHIQAVQKVLLHTNKGFAKDWQAHDFSGYNPKLQARLTKESNTI